MTVLNREDILKLCECLSELQLKICELCGYTNCGVKDGITKRREKLTDEELERDATMFLSHVRKEVCLFSNEENSKMKAILKVWRDKHFDFFKRIDSEIAK